MERGIALLSGGIDSPVAIHLMEERLDIIAVHFHQLPLTNLTIITKHIGLEIFRSVLAYDKQEIVKVAEKIGTYEISKGPEICSLLWPKRFNGS